MEQDAALRECAAPPTAAPEEPRGPPCRPAVVISYLLSGIAATLGACCYAEVRVLRLLPRMQHASQARPPSASLR